MYRMLGLGARELLYGRAEIAAGAAGPARRRQPEQVRDAAAALRRRAARCCSSSPGPSHRGAGMTVTVPTDPAHRTAEEIGRTAAGPRPLPPLGPTREVPLPDVLERHAAQRAAGARRPPGRGCRWSSCGCGCPFGRRRARATSRAWPSCSPSTLLTGTVDPGPGRRSTTSWPRWAPTSGVGVDPERLSISGSGLAAGLADDARRARPTCSPTATHPDAEVARERERLVERITVARAQPRTIAREALQRKRFGDHPVTREMPTGPDGRGRHRRQVRALQAAGAGAGRRDPDPRRRPRPGRRDRARSSRPAGRLDRRAPGRAADRAAARHRRRPGPGAPARVGAVAAAAVRAGAAPPRRPGYAALQLANLVFGGYFSSRWMENIREDKGYTYGAHSGHRVDPGRCGAVGVETDVASDVTAAALLETRYELGRHGRGAADRRRRSTRPARYAIGSLLISLDSQGGLASTLAALAADGLDVDWLRGHPARLEAVTVDEVAAAALRVLRAGRVHRGAGRRRRRDRARRAGARRDRR